VACDLVVFTLLRGFYPASWRLLRVVNCRIDRGLINLPDQSCVKSYLAERSASFIW
jgi:hypothetical protein